MQWVLGREVPVGVKASGVNALGRDIVVTCPLDGVKQDVKVTIDFILLSRVLRSTESPKGSHLASCHPVGGSGTIFSPQPPVSSLLLGPEVPHPFYSQVA